MFHFELLHISELVSDSSCSINVNDITLEAVEGVLQILKRVSETASPLRVLRVFYRGDLFTANEISQGILLHMNIY